MKKIRLLLAYRPRIRREVIRELIKRQPDMEIVGEVLDPVKVLLAAKDTQPDVVVVSLSDSEESGLSSHLLGEYPNLTVLGLASEGDAAFIEQLCPWRREIVEPSEANIVGAIRDAINAPCSPRGERARARSR